LDQLDNCEHLLDQVAEAAEAILGSCPQISMVATSREGLAVRGEQVIPVPSLRSHAADLFTARAEEVSPGFGANAETAEVEALCARLDGLPLAIELAAARTRTLTTAEILERLDQSFRLLRGGRRQVERHQTIRATVEWSYDLLGDPEKVTFNRLSVFAGWFTAADAEAVVADGEVIEDFDVLEHLDSLVSKSMVQSDTTGSVGRFRLLETLRQFAAEQLQEAGEDLKVRDRHAARFEALIRHWQERLYSGDFASALSKLESLSDEASAAMDWLLESGDVDLAGQIYVNGRMIFVSEQLDESMRRSEQITNRVDEMSPENQVTVLGQACWAAFNQSDFANGVKWGEKAVAIADAEGLGFPPSVGTGLPTALSFTGQPDRALEVARLALEAATSQANSQTGRPEELVIAMMSVSSAALAESPAEAVDLGRTGLAMAIELGGAIWIASAQTTLARALSLTDPVEALRYAREAVEGGVYPNLRLSANALAAWLEAANGNAAAASARIAVGLALFEDLGRHYMYLAFLDSAALTYSDADPHTAALLLGARSTFQAQIGLEGTPYERHVHDKALAEVKGRLSNKDFEAAFAEGAELDLEEALGLVGEITERAESASSVQG
jgi:predicted ATPase